MKGNNRKTIDWTNKWRINIYLDKTEICVFSKKSIDDSEKLMVIKEQTSQVQLSTKASRGSSGCENDIWKRY